MKPSRLVVLVVVLVVIGPSMAGCDVAFDGEPAGPSALELEAIAEADEVSRALGRCMRRAGADVQLDDVNVGAVAVFDPEERGGRGVAWLIEPGTSEVSTEWAQLRRAEKAIFDRCLRSDAPGYKRIIPVSDGE